MQGINLIENDLRARRCSKARLKYDFLLSLWCLLLHLKRRGDDGEQGRIGGQGTKRQSPKNTQPGIIPTNTFLGVFITPVT